jgi:hypothetical protein
MAKSVDDRGRGRSVARRRRILQGRPGSAAPAQRSRMSVDKATPFIFQSRLRAQSRLLSPSCTNSVSGTGEVSPVSVLPIPIRPSPAIKSIDSSIRGPLVSRARRTVRVRNGRLSGSLARVRVSGRSAAGKLRPASPRSNPCRPFRLVLRPELAVLERLLNAMVEEKEGRRRGASRRTAHRHLRTLTNIA